MIPWVRWWWRVGACVLVLWSISGCTARTTVPVADATAWSATRADDAGKMQRIVAYRTSDWARHPFDGFVVDQGDSLRFFRPAQREGRVTLGRPKVAIVLHRDSVVTVETVDVDVGPTVLICLLAASGMVLLMGWAAFNDQSMM